MVKENNDQDGCPEGDTTTCSANDTVNADGSSWTCNLNIPEPLSPIKEPSSENGSLSSGETSSLTTAPESDNGVELPSTNGPVCNLNIPGPLSPIKGPSSENGSSSSGEPSSLTTAPESENGVELPSTNGPDCNLNIPEPLSSIKEPASENGSLSSCETLSLTTAPTSEPGLELPSSNGTDKDDNSKPTQSPTLDNGSSPQRAPVVWLRSCDEETVTPIEGRVTGEIPSWLNGRLTRNGPGKLQYGDTRYNHLFDGSAYLHQYNIKNGHVTYQSRFLQSNTYMKNSRANRILVSEFGTVAYPDPCKTLLQRFMSAFDPPGKNPTDNCSVNVVYMGDELYAMTETPHIRRLDPDTLACMGDKTDLKNYIAVNQATAHPHVDPDGTVYNMGNSYEGKGGPTYNIIKFPPPKEVDGQRVSSFEQAEIIASIPCQWKMYPSYYHSFGISDNYFVFVEMPFVFNIKKFLFNHYFGKPMFGALDWLPNEKTNFRIVRRDTGELIKTAYKADAFLTFHHTNAYEKDGQLVVELCGISNGECVYQLMLKNFENPDFEASPCTMSTQRRYVIPLDVADAEQDTNLVTLKDTKCQAYKRADQSIEVVGEKVSEVYFDLPRINYKHNGKDYSYAYGVELDTKGVEFCSLVKMNVKTGETKKWANEGILVSEPVFVEEPEALDEDQGVVLSALLDKHNPKYTSLLVLDAKTWTERGRVEFEANGVVTSTFHGMFAGSEELIHRY